MHDFKNKRILVTGGAGFIGSNLAKRLASLGAFVTVFDKFKSPESLGDFRNLFVDGKLLDCEVIVGDISRDLHLIEGVKFDYIFHKAAISDTTFSDEGRMLEVNYHAFCQILKLAQKCGAKVIYASSAATYGNSASPNAVGSGECPLNIYGFSKLLMDHKTRALLEQDAVIGLRYFNVYGPGEAHKGRTASMIYQLSKQALEAKKCALFEFGEQRRDFVYIEDVVQANLLAAKVAGGGGQLYERVFNIASGVSRSYNEIVAILRGHLGDFEVEYIPNLYPFFQTHTCADVTPAREILGFTPAWDLERGILEYIEIIKRACNGKFD